ncbi:MAG: hypothetical protein WD960_15200 [Gemmatimonadota bacterium]
MGGPLALLGPKIRARVNRSRGSEVRLARGLVLGGVALVFWGLLFAATTRMLLHFRGAEGIGDLLAAKTLGIVLLTFLLILLLSNVITALSTFFLARDLELLVASPCDPLHLYWARLTESAANSSWMVVLLAVPLLVGYGVVYGGGPLFYLLALMVLLPLLALPAVAGAALTLLLVNIFPARRTRDLLALMALLAAAGVIFLVRLVQPERLVRPEEARSVVDFLANLGTPTSPWLPSEWASQALMGWLTGSFDPFPALLLWSSAAAALVVGGALHLRYFETGHSKAQEGAQRLDAGRKSRRLEGLVTGVDVTRRELILKEMRVFFRDTTQWSQLVLLGVLVVVYVYNIRVLPVGVGEGVSFFLVNAIAFLNLGLAGFVVAAVAARFIFPAVSLEGRTLWLLHSSPLDPRTLLWTKYWIGTIPLLLISLPLIVGTNLILRVDPLILGVSVGTMFGMTLALSAMALSFGALFPSFETENPAEIPTSFGGLVFMMTAVAYLMGVVVLTGWPVHAFLRAGLEGTDAGAGAWIPLAGGLGGAFLLTLAVSWGSLRAGFARVGVGP